MGVVGHFQVLGNLRTITIEVVRHIVVFFTQDAPADKIAAATGHSHKSTVELVGKTLCEAQSGKQSEDRCENKLFHKIVSQL